MSIKVAGLPASARRYAAEPVLEFLSGIACDSALALCLDLDALERSTSARVDGVMFLALEALCHSDVRVILLADEPRGRAALVARRVPGSACVERAVSAVRAQAPRHRLIAISDDRDLLSGLAPEDRGLCLGSQMIDVSVRATLWWLADVRSRAGLHGDVMSSSSLRSTP